MDLTGVQPAPATDAIGLAAEELGAALLTLGRAYLGAVRPILASLPHGARGYHTLDAVARGEHSSQAALARWLGIDRTVMTYLLDDLVQAGLVQRQLNAGDRRQRRVVTTTQGRKRLASLQRQVREAENTLLVALNDVQRDKLRGLLRAALRGMHPATFACGTGFEAGPTVRQVAPR